MGVDKYADEPAVEIDPAAYAQWKQAKAALKAWEVEEKRWREVVEKQLGAAHAGTINGTKVVTNRPIATYRTRDLLAQYPDLTAHYFEPGPEVFNVTAFARMHPEVAEQFHSRSFKDAS